MIRKLFYLLLIFVGVYNLHLSIQPGNLYLSTTHLILGLSLTLFFTYKLSYSYFAKTGENEK